MTLGATCAGCPGYRCTDRLSPAGLRRALLPMLALLVALGAGAAPAAASDLLAFELASLSLEELMDVEVSLTSRKAEPLFEAAAAVAVLSADDLRRAGVTSIPEALRLVPGMTVARVATTSRHQLLGWKRSGRIRQPPTRNMAVAETAWEFIWNSGSGLSRRSPSRKAAAPPSATYQAPALR